MAGEPPAGAQAVMRAIDVLDLFSIERRTLTIAEICDLTGLTTATASRLVRALQSRDLLMQEPSSRGFTVGPAAIRLAGIAMSGDDLVYRAQEGLDRLRELSGETVSLHARAGAMRVCISELVSHAPIRMASGVGMTYPLTSGAAGKVIAAALPRPSLLAALARDESFNSESPEAQEALFEELDQVTKQGFAESVGETVIGASAIAALISRTDIQSPVSINITGPAVRFTAEARAAVLPHLLEEARELSALSPQMHF